MNRTVDAEEYHGALEDTMYIGDPVLVKKNNRCFVAAIKSIQMANKSVKCYHIDQQCGPTLHLELQELELIEMAADGRHHWNGQYIGTRFQVKGEYTTPIKPDIDCNAPHGMTAFVFDRSLMMDMGVLLRDVPESCDNDKLKCRLCTKKIPQLQMRAHIASHILKDDLEYRCGYCGLDTCTSVLKKTTRSKSKQYYKVESNCLYYVAFGKTPKTFSSRVKCTNHLMRCRLCSEVDIWKYHLQSHFNALHDGCELQEDETITKQERTYICKL